MMLKVNALRSSRDYRPQSRKGPTCYSAMPASCPYPRLTTCASQDWDEMIDVNIKEVLYGMAAALPFPSFLRSIRTSRLSSALTIVRWAS